MTNTCKTLILEVDSGQNKASCVRSRMGHLARKMCCSGLAIHGTRKTCAQDGSKAQAPAPHLAQWPGSSAQDGSETPVTGLALAPHLA